MVDIARKILKNGRVTMVKYNLSVSCRRLIAVVTNSNLARRGTEVFFEL